MNMFFAKFNLENFYYIRKTITQLYLSFFENNPTFQTYIIKKTYIAPYSLCKGKVIPLQAQCGPEGG
jgi:hypothetical protein